MTNNNNINLEIGIFFDGSGCNYVNTAQTAFGQTLVNPYNHDVPNYTDMTLSDIEKLFKKYFGATQLANLYQSKAEATPLTTCLNYSNIYRLYQYYLNKNDTNSGNYYGAIYVEGVGTQDNVADSNIWSLFGNALGRGVAGASGKYVRSTYYLKNKLTEMLQQLPSDCKNITLTFNLFGFSRGAAIARHFANQVAQLSDTTSYLYQNTYGVIASYNKTLTAAPSVNFIGLFDTVKEVFEMSTVSPHDSDTIGNIDIHMPKGICKQALQLTSMHECRYNFPLSSIQGVYPEVQLLGVHTDLGGSYIDGSDTTTPIYTKPVHLLNYSNHLAVAMEQATQQLSQMQSYPIWGSQFTPDKAEAANTTYLSYVGVVWTQPIKPLVRQGNLQYANLFAMLAVVQQVGLAFDYTSLQQAFAEQLIPIKDIAATSQARALAAFNGSSIPDFSESQKQTALENYVHCSVDWQTIISDYGQTPQYLNSEEEVSVDYPDDMYTNRSDTNWTRKVFTPAN